MPGDDPRLVMKIVAVMCIIYAFEALVFLGTADNIADKFEVVKMVQLNVPVLDAIIWVIIGFSNLIFFLVSLLTFDVAGIPGEARILITIMNIVMFAGVMLAMREALKNVSNLIYRGMEFVLESGKALLKLLPWY